jgi:hypothetical protein
MLAHPHQRRDRDCRYANPTPCPAGPCPRSAAPPAATRLRPAPYGQARPCRRWSSPSRRRSGSKVAVRTAPSRRAGPDARAPPARPADRRDHRCGQQDQCALDQDRLARIGWRRLVEVHRLDDLEIIEGARSPRPTIATASENSPAWTAAVEHLQLGEEAEQRRDAGEAEHEDRESPPRARAACATCRTGWRCSRPAGHPRRASGARSGSCRASSRHRPPCSTARSPRPPRHRRRGRPARSRHC